MLLNGRIYTMNPELPIAEAVAIIDSKIVAVGKSSDVENLSRRNFQVIDLEGKTVIPGLIDCHTHFLSFAYSLHRVNLQGFSSFEKLLSAVRSFSRKLKPDEWLVGDGWDKNILGDQSLFTKETLDNLWPEAPALLQSKDHHLLWVNSKTLKAAGIDENTDDPPGGRIERDPLNREATGLLKENACNLVWDRVPSLPTTTSERLLREAMKIANSYGLTGIHDFEGQRAFDLFRQMAADNELTLRVAYWIPDGDLDSAMNLGTRSGFGDEAVRFGGVKLYCDGTLGSQTASMFEPYEGSADNCGICVTPQEQLTEIARKASQAGISVAIHAIGDKAVHQALNAIEASAPENIKENRLRHRIEHIQLLHSPDVERFKKLRVIASVQPVHAPSDRDVAEKYWGKRCKLAYAYQTLRKSGAQVVFGSDVPIETLNPWSGIYAAVTRKKTNEDESWYPKEKLGLAEAVSAYTRWASYASYEENVKGSIQIGKLGDMVILSQDVFEIEPERLPETKAECTILGGKIAFQA